jgi:hypothetical protein
MKNIALCLYGQPRDFRIGKKNLFTLFDGLQSFNVDVFINTWLPEGAYYKVSPYRKVDIGTLTVENDIIENLKSFFKPKVLTSQNPIVFKKRKLKFSELYKLTDSKIMKKNINNILSQLYSKNIVLKNLLDYHQKTKINYDYVIGSRFDFYNKFDTNIEIFDSSKINISSQSLPRKFIRTDIVICNINGLSSIYNAYENLENLINNKILLKEMEIIGENPRFNAEEITTMNYLYNCKNFDNVNYDEKIPNFI